MALPERSVTAPGACDRRDQQRDEVTMANSGDRICELGAKIAEYSIPGLRLSPCQAVFWPVRFSGSVDDPGPDHQRRASGLVRRPSLSLAARLALTYCQFWFHHLVASTAGQQYWIAMTSVASAGTWIIKDATWPGTRIWEDVIEKGGEGDGGIGGQEQQSWGTFLQQGGWRVRLRKPKRGARVLAGWVGVRYRG
ncbi:uncharacterized protein LY79DRAFT_577779 [Colletotrichum navitas]|uniref:Uncharacterized protein n=1 Tax=Colletotrichum navitas TaxID=681940 RepID=A0AAD8Q658_9PEZI|nr:uncharacterized protein LY79DRAFT_577779 [Colletotrichum navitas]KAK1595827.1 hypothetical protein LY79DRAFT_577779 [Colletotrichum navitas]